MQTPKERFSRLVDADVLDSMKSSIVDVSDGRYMPPYVYASEEWFEFEKAAVYDRSWLCVGRLDLLRQPGDYYTVTINDDPLMVVMDDEGQVRVMSSVCQHRGHLLAEDSGNAETGLFRCPLHHWSYDLKGRLRHAPEMGRTNDFSRSDVCLPQLKVELWQGFVFAHFDDDAPPLAPTLAKLEGRDGQLRRGQHGEPPAHGHRGLPVELEGDARELHGALPQTPTCTRAYTTSPWATASSTTPPTRTSSCTPPGSTGSWAPSTPCTRPLLPEIEGLSDQQRRQVMFAMIPPMMPLGLVPDHMFYFLVLPHGANQITIRVGLCFPPESLQVRNFGKIVDWIVDGIMMYNDQDVEADTSVQKGLRSRFAPRGRFSWKETTVAQLNRWLHKRYAEYAEETGLVAR